jgi:uncharacterized delta-60 repeat protein
LIALLALLLGLLTLPAAARGAGELDPSFDGDGRVLTDFGGDDFGSAMAIQSDGKIVSAGRSDAGAQPAANFALARHNPDGSLDPTFGSDGTVLTDFGSSEAPEAVEIQADGKIVAAGLSGGGADIADFALARYNPDGSLDLTFGGDGIVLTDFGALDGANDIAIQADGKIVAAGTTLAGDNPFNFALARYNPDGSLDAAFDGDGRVLTDFGSGEGAQDVGIQADGKIVAAGFSFAGANPGNFALARYLPNGPLPTNKAQCKNGGYARFGFKNQGLCVAFVQRGSKP